MDITTIPDKVREYLSADDLEMVQLGANLLPQFTKKNQWPEILDHFSKASEGRELGTSTLMNTQASSSLTITTTRLYAFPKWQWHIIDNRIEIEEYKIGGGLYSQLNTRYKTTYNTKTFSMNTLTSAIEGYFTNKIKTNEKKHTNKANKRRTKQP